MSVEVTPGGADRSRFVRFLVAAGLSVPVNLGSRVLLSLVVPYEIAIVVSHVFGMFTAWLLTRLFVFERSGRNATAEFGRFALVNLMSVTQTWIVSVGLVRFVFPALDYHYQPELIGHVIGLVSSAATSFWGHRHFSFAKVGSSHATG